MAVVAEAGVGVDVDLEVCVDGGVPGAALLAEGRPFTSAYLVRVVGHRAIEVETRTKERACAVAVSTKKYGEWGSRLPASPAAALVVCSGNTSHSGLLRPLFTSTTKESGKGGT